MSLVRTSPISKENFTGSKAPVYVLDCAVKLLPVPKILVRTPYFAGNVLAKRLCNLLYEWTPGNIPKITSAEGRDSECM